MVTFFTYMYFNKTFHRHMLLCLFMIYILSTYFKGVSYESDIALYIVSFVLCVGFYACALAAVMNYVIHFDDFMEELHKQVKKRIEDRRE